MRIRYLVLSIALSMTVPYSAMASTSHPVNDTSARAGQLQQNAAGYLGVILHPVPRALRTHVAAVLPSGQGVMISDVVDGSPADNAGLQDYDILLSLDDQKLFSADQLGGLIRAEGPDRTVQLKLVRHGEVKDITVTLGEANDNASGSPVYDMPRMPMHHRYQHPFAPFNAGSSQASEGSWESFDQLTLQRRDDGSYQAQIQYLDDSGKLTKHEYTGTREEIRKQIKAEKDLPATERNQLLGALSARNEHFRPMMPFAYDMRPMPWHDMYPE